MPSLAIRCSPISESSDDNLDDTDMEEEEEGDLGLFEDEGEYDQNMHDSVDVHANSSSSPNTRNSPIIVRANSIWVRRAKPRQQFDPPQENLPIVIPSAQSVIENDTSRPPVGDTVLRKPSRFYPLAMVDSGALISSSGPIGQRYGVPAGTLACSDVSNFDAGNRRNCLSWYTHEQNDANDAKSVSRDASVLQQLSCTEVAIDPRPQPQLETRRAREDCSRLCAPWPCNQEQNVKEEKTFPVFGRDTKGRARAHTVAGSSKCSEIHNRARLVEKPQTGQLHSCETGDEPETSRLDIKSRARRRRHTDLRRPPPGISCLKQTDSTEQSPAHRNLFQEVRAAW